MLACYTRTSYLFRMTTCSRPSMHCKAPISHRIILPASLPLLAYPQTIILYSGLFSESTCTSVSTEIPPTSVFAVAWQCTGSLIPSPGIKLLLVNSLTAIETTRCLSVQAPRQKQFEKFLSSLAKLRSICEESVDFAGNIWMLRLPPRTIGVDRRDLLQIYKLLERICETLVRVDMPLPAQLPRLINAQRSRPSPLEHPVLERPCPELPSRLRLRTSALVADAVPYFLLVCSPLREAELQLCLTLLRKRLPEDLIGCCVCAKVLCDSWPHITPAEVVTVCDVQRFVRRFRSGRCPDSHVCDESRVRQIIVAFPVTLIRWHGGFSSKVLADQEVERVCQS